MTQKEAAEQLGVTQQTIYTWEKEPNKIPIGKAYKLASTYGLPLDAIDFSCN
jgi:DNA-binding XRE family transcriptional regulator